MRSLYDNVSTMTVSTSVKPQNATLTVTITGKAVDTLGYNSGVLRVAAASCGSAIASATVVVALTECATIGGTYTVARDNTGATIGFTLTPNNVDAYNEARVEGLLTNRLRFLQVVVYPNFTSGSQSQVFGEVVLGRAYTLPTDTAVSNT